MDGRQHRYEISRPQHIPSPPPPPPRPQEQPLAPKFSEQPAPIQALWSSNPPRPLSDIRELSEPSLMENSTRYPNRQCRQPRNELKAGLDERRNSLKRTQSSQARSTFPSPNEEACSSLSHTPEQSTFYSIPQSSVPQRSSSHKRSNPSSHVPRSDFGVLSKPMLRPSRPTGASQPTYSIPNRDGSHSPVKEARLRLDPITSETARRVSSQTHVKSPHMTDILECPTSKHPRVKLDLQVSAPLFVGGGSVEGFIKVTVDDNEPVKHRRSISIGAMTVDLLGFEEVHHARTASFIALGTDIVDRRHPPPQTMTQPPSPLFADDKFWSLIPSCTALPFMISLPLDTGPPPFQSKHANIRFLLAVTAFLRDAGKHYRVRTSQDIHVLPTYDPEKALTSLPSPLTACDELLVSRGPGYESIKITAGLHRQVWVSGNSIFVDVHISNRCKKPVKKLELTLERNILCYKHTAAVMLQNSPNQARVFESNEQLIVARSLFKCGDVTWSGVEPHTSDTRTCELELPRGHGTVPCGKFFEVRFFLNVSVALSNSKLVSVQLPIILIHMNSLDVVPNSVAQVAAAIEQRRAQLQLDQPRPSKTGAVHSRQRSVSSPLETSTLRRRPSYAQGRAFAAPRQQSLDRQREHREAMEELQQTLDPSPRKLLPPSTKYVTIKRMGSDFHLNGSSAPQASTESLARFATMSKGHPSSQRHFRHADMEDTGFRGRLRKVGSLDSVRSWRSAASKQSKNARENLRPRMQHNPEPQQIPPQALGLMTSTRQVGVDIPLRERSTTAMSLREKLDRSQFEFKGVRKKASGTLKERSMAWWESRKNNNDEQRQVVSGYQNAGWI